VIALEKNLMNREVGIGRRLLTALERQQVSFEHMPTGIDTLSLVVESSYLKGKLDRCWKRSRECRPDQDRCVREHLADSYGGPRHASNAGLRSVVRRAGSANVDVRMIRSGFQRHQYLSSVLNERI
jgi:aspartate kinase